MKIAALSNARMSFSFEVFPPKTDAGMGHLMVSNGCSIPAELATIIGRYGEWEDVETILTDAGIRKDI